MTDIDTLAAAAGIEPGFYDLFGKHYPLKPEGAQRILAALGLPADDEAARADSLRRITEAPWRAGIGGAQIVAAERQPATLHLHAPADLTHADWHITLEDGEVVSGRFDLTDAPVDGERTIDGAAMARHAVRLNAALPEGYHRLAVTLGEREVSVMLAVCPKQCWTPADADSARRLFGVSGQLYSLRTGDDLGMGQFPALERLVGRAAEAGADIVGLNPLHAGFPAEPTNASPYSPSHRDFLNVLYIDPRSVPEVAKDAIASAMLDAPERKAALAKADGADLVDYQAVTDLLLPVLRAGFDAWERADAGRRRRFAAFRDAEGEPLEAFARFHALQAHFSDGDPFRLYWRHWPEDFQHPYSPAVEAWVADNRAAVDFHIWLQWLADEQLGQAAGAAREAGMAIGLYRDLAVGVGPGSAAAWAGPERLAHGTAVGAPPDMLNMLGQNWGLVPLNPLKLPELDYAPWIEAVRSNMRHAGALRIDHVMALQHLFWVPEGMSGADGAYVEYPFREMRRLLALESQRQRCVVIGEDLGTVPVGFRQVMQDSGVQSYKVFMFERVGDGLFKRPDTHPPDSLITFGTHDLPTCAGFWQGRDLEVRRDLGLYPDEKARKNDAEGRADDKRKLMDAMIDQGLIDRIENVETYPMTQQLLVAVHRYMARAPCRLAMVQLEDLAGQVDMMNMPGTVDSHPNWRRRLPRTIDALFDDSDVRALLAAVREERAT